MADKLPTNHLAPQQRASVMNAIRGAGFSVAQEKRLVTLTVSEIRAVLSSKRKALGEDLMRPDCDAVLADLALTVPHASLSPDQVARKFDIYFALLREAGVTFPMLQRAAKRFVMEPNGGKARFFPDPGQLAELCAEDIRDRRNAIAALDRASAALDGPAATSGADSSMSIDRRLHDLAEKMKAAKPGARTEPEPVHVAIHPKAGRSQTDPAELKAAIAKRMGVSPEELQRRWPTQEQQKA